MKKTLILLVFAISARTASAQDTPMEGASLSDTDKIYGLSKFWGEVKRNFVFMEQAGGEQHWDSLYQAFIPRVLDTKDNYSYYKELQRFSTLLGDGHTGIYYPESWYYNHTPALTEYFFQLKDFDGRVYVTGINESKLQEIPLGSELVAIDGFPVNEYIETNIYPYLSSSASVKRTEALNKLFFAPTGTQREALFRLPDGSERRLTLTNNWLPKPEKILPIKESVLFDYKELDGGLCYIALNSFADPAIMDEFKKAFPKLKQAKGIVIDLRNNGGGNSLYARDIIFHLTHVEKLQDAKSYTIEYNAAFASLAPYLIEHPEVQAEDPLYVEAVKAAQNGFKHEILAAEDLNTATDRIEVPVAVLCGNATCSAAENFLIYIDPLENFFTVGEPSYGSTGSPIDGTLPGGGSYRICTVERTYPDGRKFINLGIRPDIEVRPSLRDYISDKDVVLKRAIAELNQKIQKKKR